MNPLLAAQDADQRGQQVLWHWRWYQQQKQQQQQQEKQQKQWQEHTGNPRWIKGDTHVELVSDLNKLFMVQ